MPPAVINMYLLKCHTRNILLFYLLLDDMKLIVGTRTTYLEIPHDECTDTDTDQDLGEIFDLRHKL
jgi:hypothetical protein